MRVFDHANLSPRQLTAIADELRDQHNLNDVMRWALADKTGAFLPGVVSDVIVQDEFSHDVVVPFRDNLVLVYDTT